MTLRSKNAGDHLWPCVKTNACDHKQIYSACVQKRTQATSFYNKLNTIKILIQVY